MKMLMTLEQLGIFFYPIMHHSAGNDKFASNKFHLAPDTNWASSRENLSSGCPTKRDSNQSPQLQRLARKLRLHL